MCEFAKFCVGSISIPYVIGGLILGIALSLQFDVLPVEAACSSPTCPVVTSVAPTTGAVGGGEAVLIEGTNFCDPVGGVCTVTIVSVKFGTTAAAFTVASDTRINAVSPSVSLPGLVDVVVGKGALGQSATSSADEFTYFQPPTGVVAVSDVSGQALTYVQIFWTIVVFIGAVAIGIMVAQMMGQASG